MTQEIPAQSIDLKSQFSASADTRLSRWLLFSFLFHLIFIVGLFVSPWFPTRKAPGLPVYSVDLVGGEKIGGHSFGTELVPGAASKASPQKAETADPIPAPRAKITRNKVEPKPAAVTTRKSAEPDSSARDAVAMKSRDAVAMKSNVKKDLATKEPRKTEAAEAKAAETKTEAASDTASLDSVRERIMQSAAERAKNRNQTAQNMPKGEPLSSYTGEGVGALALGQGGRGGPGIVKGKEHVIYQNHILSTIKNNWVWAGPRSNIRVVVQFNIRDSGEIVGLKIVQSSGNPSYDESVLRAVRKSSPLAPLVESLRSAFSEVELGFRPEDLEV